MDWKSKALKNYDASFVKTKLLSKDLVQKLGSEYLVAQAWLASLDKANIVNEAMKAKYEEDCKQWTQVLGDTRDLVSAILLYNLMVHKFDSCKDDSKKRDAVKDTKKKLRKQFGAKYTIPEDINSRVMNAINKK